MWRAMFRALLLATFLSDVRCARILFVVGTPSYSHQVIFQPIWRELSLRGHQVTAITSEPLKDPALTNLTELDMHFAHALLHEKYHFGRRAIELKDSPLKFARFFTETISAVQEEQLASVPVQRLIKDGGAKFDVVLVEFLLPTMLAFGHRFGCPIIALTSLDASYAGHDSVGNPTHPAFYTESTLKFGGKLTFFQRVFSAVYSVVRRVVFKFVREREDRVVAKYFGAGYPPLADIVKRIDMFFMNVNPAFHNVGPTVPAVVHIGGGMHIKPPKPLPKDLQEFLDGAKEGVIYFSMGTNVRTNTLSSGFVKVLLAAFAELPYKILWKLDKDELPGKPENVLLKKWLPQQDILRHPNVKVFLTQGGLQSIEEAIIFRVPVIGIPIFGDQFSNVIQAVNKGFGLYIDQHTVDKDTLKGSVLEVIKNPKYKENINKLAEISKDQPLTGLEKAVWWTEYVLRHKGAKHLRSPAVDMPLYQYFMLDVIAFLGALVFLSTHITVKTMRCCCKMACRFLGRCKTNTKKIKKK